MPTFGKTGVGAVNAVISADYIQVCSVAGLPPVLSENGLVSKLSLYCSNASGSTQVLKAVIYTDNVVAPDVLKATGTEVSIPTGTAAGWVDLPISPSVSLLAGSYWLGWHAGPTNEQILYYYDDVENFSLKYKAHAYASGPLDPLGGVSTVDKEVSIYATYETPPGPTLNTVVQSNMRSA